MLRTFVGAGTAALLTLGLVGSAALPANASRDEVEREQERVQDEVEQSAAELEHVASELVTAAARLEELEVQVPAARAAVATAESAAEAARVRDAELAQELRLAEAAVEAAGVQLAERRDAAGETQQVVAGVAREVYQGAGFNGLTMLLEAGSAQQYTDMVVLASTARRSQELALGRLRVQQAEIRNAEARLDADRARVVDLKAEAAEQVVAMRAAEQEARDAQAALEGLVAEHSSAVELFAAAKAEEEAELAGLQQQQADLESRLAEIAAAELAAEQARVAAEEAERRRAAEAEAARAAAEDRAPAPRRAPEPAPQAAASAGGYLSAPIGARINSEFGYRVHPILGTRRLHAGADFAAGCGTPVVAAADGRVVSAGVAGGYGNQVVVSHGVVSGSSLATSYNHLSRIAVSGGSVSRGQVIGYVGTTGLSTGCHLHFETRESGAPVNPRNWL